jgi:hypothetical protein
VPGALVPAEIGAVAGDVALSEGVATEQVVHSGPRRGQQVVLAGHQVRRAQHHQVVADAPVGPPGPRAVGRIRLTPGLVPLERAHPPGRVGHQRGRTQAQVRRSGHPVVVEAVDRERLSAVMRRRLDRDPVDWIARGQPELGGGPEEIVAQVVVAIGPTAVGAVLVGGEIRLG